MKKENIHLILLVSLVVLAFVVVLHFVFGIFGNMKPVDDSYKNELRVRDAANKEREERADYLIKRADSVTEAVRAEMRELRAERARNTTNISNSKTRHDKIPTTISTWSEDSLLRAVTRWADEN